MTAIVLLPEYGPAFDPASVPGLFYWFDFSDTSTLFQDTGGTTPVTANGQPIGRVNNQPGATARWAQGANAPLPVWNSAGQNGLGTVFVDHAGAGGNGCLRDPNATLRSSPFTMFWAATTPALTAGVSLLCDQFGCGGNRAVYANNGPSGPVGVYNGTFLSTTIPHSTFRTVTIEWNVTTTVWDQTILNVSGNAGSAGQSAFQLGLLCNGTANSGAGLHVGEFLQYDGALAPADVTNIQNYLVNKWGA